MSRASGYRLFSIMIQATLKGMGVALGHSLLIAPYLERGTLVELFEPPLAAPARYFLAVAPGSEDRLHADAFDSLACPCPSKALSMCACGGEWRRDADRARLRPIASYP